MFFWILPTEPHRPNSVFQKVIPFESAKMGMRLDTLIQLVISGMILFTLGGMVATLITLLQSQSNIAIYPTSFVKLFSTAMWIPAVCGSSAVFVGCLYPLADIKIIGKPYVTENNWANIIRCLVMFLGFNYATTKVPFSDNVQLSVSLAVFAVMFWFLFDRTLHGFVLAMLIGIGGTVASSLLVFSGAYSFTRSDFIGIRSFIPCLFFASGVCFGAIGRQLAVSTVVFRPNNRKLKTA